MSYTRSNLLTRGMRGDANTVSGISFAWDGDWYHVSGTATGDIGWRAYKSTDIPIVADKKYTLSVEFAGGMPDADSYFSTSFQLFSDFRNNRYKVYSTYRNEHVILNVDQGTLAQYKEGFQLWGPIIKGGATVDMRVRWMLVAGDTPAAWAPAKGEGLAGGGAQMSANLLDGVKPRLAYGSMIDGVITSSTPKDDWKDVATWPITTGKFAENQTMHLGISAKWHGAAATTGTAWACIKYADASGYTNSVNVKIDGITTEWKRLSLSAVVPSGMHVVDFRISADHIDAAFDATSLVLSYGSPVCLASSAHTPYATQDHVSVTYATKASLKVTDDSVKAEVSARAKTDRMVSEVSSRLTQTADGFSASIDRLSDTDKKVNSWFGFGSDSSGNPQLTMGSSTSPVVGVYTNTGLAYKARSGATLLELDGASRSSTMPHVHADDVSIGSWQWVPTQNGTHFTLQWIGG